MNKLIKDMTNEELADLFKSLDDYCDFDKVALKLASRPDVHAMIVLDRLCPNLQNYSLQPMIECVRSSHVWYTADTERFKQVATLGIVHDLVRCGLCYSSEKDRFFFISSGELTA